jgi:hypothetical protein
MPADHLLLKNEEKPGPDGPFDGKVKDLDRRHKGRLGDSDLVG